MKPILKSKLYTCPKCNAYFEVEQGDEIPSYCKRCETEFDELERTRYKLLKLVDGEWYAEGVEHIDFGGLQPFKLERSDNNVE